jgi:hypothetical protein
MNNQSKTNKIIYWTSTIIIVLFILPGIFYLNSEMAKQGTQHLGIPEWLRLEISIGQIIGGIIIIIPGIGWRLKEWAYVGLGIKYLSAFIGHAAVDGFYNSGTFFPLLILGILLISYIYFHKLYNRIV